MVILVTFQIKTGMKISEKIKSLENNDKFSPSSLLATENEFLSQTLEKET